jgi:hypothetical protein
MTRGREEFHVLEDVDACLEVLGKARLIAVLRTIQLTTGMLKTELAHSNQDAIYSRQAISFTTPFSAVLQGTFSKAIFRTFRPTLPARVLC